MAISYMKTTQACQTCFAVNLKIIVFFPYPFVVWELNKNACFSVFHSYTCFIVRCTSFEIFELIFIFRRNACSEHLTYQTSHV